MVCMLDSAPVVEQGSGKARAARCWRMRSRASKELGDEPRWGEYDYTAYGARYPPNTSETVTQPYQFTGRHLNPISQTQDNRYRTYFQELGRFGSRDPYRSYVSTNHHLYIYAANDPSIAADPFGLKEVCCVKRFDVTKYSPIRVAYGWSTLTTEGISGWSRFGSVRQYVKMHAEFLDPPNKKGNDICCCKCCEYRQRVVLHDVWINGQQTKNDHPNEPREDVSDKGAHYGHRDERGSSSDRYWDPRFQQPSDAATEAEWTRWQQEMERIGALTGPGANERPARQRRSACIYDGEDMPGRDAIVTPGSTWRVRIFFESRIIDTCNGGDNRRILWSVDIQHTFPTEKDAGWKTEFEEIPFEPTSGETGWP